MISYIAGRGPVVFMFMFMSRFIKIVTKELEVKNGLNFVSGGLVVQLRCEQMDKRHKLGIDFSICKILRKR